VEEVEGYNKKTKLLQTTGTVGQSVTSTSLNPQTKSDFIERPIESLLKPKKFMEPGYAKIETNYGSLNVELDAKYSPKAVYNFVKLAQDSYYEGVVFHRNIKNFMIQGGDPTGTGEGGKSAFGKPFADETNTPLKHDSRGILSMANRGKNTNTSQFFITYRRAPHLDGKHTVFGRVVGGMQVLDSLERAPVDNNDRPIKDIKIISITVLVDPFIGGLYGQAERQVQEVTPEDNTPWLKKSSQSAGAVGKYLNNAQASKSGGNVARGTANASDKKKVRATTSISKSNFAGW
jgi:peptidyl-prolyl cis-trans isomerase-like protein 2